MIQSKELKLKLIDIDDLEVLTKWNFDPEINPFLPKRPNLDIEKQKLWLESQINDPSKEKYIIELLNPKVPIGLISAMNIDTKNYTLEYGITIGEKDYWGQGIALRASKMFLQHYFQKGFRIIYLRVFSTNNRAINFFAKIGFKEEGILRNRVIDHLGNSTDFLSMSIKESELNYEE